LMDHCGRVGSLLFEAAPAAPMGNIRSTIEINSQIFTDWHLPEIVKYLLKTSAVNGVALILVMTSPCTQALWLDVHCCYHIRLGSEHGWGDWRQWTIDSKHAVGTDSY